MSETDIVKQTLLAIGREFPTTMRVWRNNTGAFRDRTGRVIRYGLVGSADILGLFLPAGRFLAIELKDVDGRQTEAQFNFGVMIASFGGVYILAKTSDYVIGKLRELT